MSRKEFIKLLAPLVVQVRLEGGTLFPSVSIAQMLLETGGTVPDWNNVVGYKVGGGSPNEYWDGSSVNTKTREVIEGVNDTNQYADWRAYSSVYNCLKDQARLFKYSRYADVVAAEDPYAQAAALYADGYATDAPEEIDGDPDYAEKLSDIIKSYTYLDEEAKAVLEKIKELEQRLGESELVITTLGNELLELQDRQSMDVPDFAKEATNAAVAAGIIDTPDGGSYDFYRVITVLHRKGLL